jgi:two-component system, cell cycle response regulator CpdR
MSTILLAEDDDSMRRFLAKALERAGHEVLSYGNGAEAFESLKETPVSLLLTDIVMPEMDGIELAKKASELQPDMKIMFITGFAAVALQEYPEAPLKSRILSKPIHLKDLVHEVDRMLAA